MKRFVIGLWMAVYLCSSLVSAAARGDDKEEKKAKEKAAEEKLTEFRKELKKVKTPQEIARLIHILGEVQHEKVLKQLISTLGTGTGDTRIAAVQEIAKYRDDKTAAQGLINGMQVNAKEKDIIVAILKALADVHVEQALPVVYQLFYSKEPEVVSEAIKVSGKIKHTASIEPLIKLLGEADGLKAKIAEYRQMNPGGLPPGVNPPAGAPGGMPQIDEEKVKVLEDRKAALDKTVPEALKDITGESFPGVKEWTQWWIQNKGKFKIEKEEKEKK